MRTSLQMNLPAMAKRSLVGLAAGCLVVLALGGTVLAATPVDIYQDMQSGNNGDVLTPSIMNASGHGNGTSWFTSGTMWVSTTNYRDLGGPVVVSGVTYNGTGGSRTWTFKENNQLNCANVTFSGTYSVVTIACYLTTGVTHQYLQFDTFGCMGNPTSTWGSFETITELGGPTGFRLESAGPSPDMTNYSLPVQITLGKPYWCNVHFDGVDGWIQGAVFDPDNGFAQVGTTMQAIAVQGVTAQDKCDFGRGDGHGNFSDILSSGYVSQVLVDYTNAAFPLLPSGYNDSTAPSAPPAVRDGTGQTATNTIALSTTQLSANWDPAVDNESGIRGYQYAVGTSKGGTNVVNWTSIIDQLSITKTGLSLTTGQTYYFSVRAINGVGLTGPAANSNGQTVGTDTTAPGVPVVRDGGSVGSDIDETSSTTDLYANFSPAIDAESGISCYQYAFGTTPGGTDTVNWTTVNGRSYLWFVHASGLSLAPGTRYYASVRAINNAGLTGSVGTSDGQIVVNSSDTTPPSAPPAVRDGTSGDISTQTSTTQLSANWDASTDAQSGISGYQYAIGTTPGGTNIVNYQYGTKLAYTGPNMSVTATGLSLTVGQTYYFSVQAINGEGLTGSPTSSNGVTIGSGGNQPPSAPANVRDGVGADITYTTSNSQLSANWDAATDPDGSVTAYQYAIGTSAGGTQTVNWTTLGNVTTVTKTGLSLTNGQTYYFSVKAVDNQGLAGNATNSNGQTVDTTAPSAPANVRDGTGTDISTTSSTTQLSANWDASADSESGISGYQYAIGTSAGGTQTVNWTSLGNVTTVTKTGLTLTIGQTYYFSVRAVNGAGLTGSATNSNGQTVISVGSVIYFQDNFESWTTHGGAWSSVTYESSTHILNTSTDYAKAGAKSLKLTDTDTTAISYGAFLTKNFSPTISGDIYVRFFVFLPTGYGSANVGCTRRLARIWCGSNRGQMSVNGDYPLLEEVGAWGGIQSPSALSENAWHCLEVHMATPSASTLMEFWVDGVKNSATLNGSFSGSTTYDHIDFGDVILATSGANGNGTFYLDELVVSNSYVGTGITAPVTYFSDNFENWTVHGGAWSSVSGESSTHTLNTSTDYARAGTKSVKITDTDTTAWSGACLTKTFSPAMSGDVYVRFYLFLPTGYGSTNVNCSRRLLAIYSGSNRALFVATGDLGYVQESIGWTSNTEIPLSENAWHCIEMHVTAPAAVTVLEWWLDGVYVNALAPNFSAGSTWSPVYLGDTSASSGGANGTGTFYLDEVIMSNAYNGPLP